MKHRVKSTHHSLLRLLGTPLIWILMLALFPQSSSAQCVPTIPDPPNIVFVMMDDLGWGSLGAYGASEIKTDNLDEFATEARRFTQYYVNAPVCSPTRISILTGDYPHRLNVRGALGIGRSWSSGRFSDRGIPSDFLTLPEMLKEECYKTGHFGKWHIGQQRNEFKPTAVGFDEYAIRIPELSQTGAEEYWREVFELTDGTLVCSNGEPYDGSQATKCDQLPHGKHLTEWLVDQAIGFLGEQTPGTPFFLNLWLRSPHIPYNPPPNWVSYYADKLSSCLPEEQPDSRGYAAMVSSADEQIGRLLDALEAFGMKESTLVIITSDNGADWNPDLACVAPNGALFKGKGSIWEGGNRVPLLVRWPNRIVVDPLNPEISSSPMVSFDWHRTLSDILGRDLMSEPATDGQSVKKQLLDGDAAAPLERDDDIFWETIEGEYPLGGRFAARGGRWRLTYGSYEAGGQTRDRLFDMSAAACVQGTMDCEDPALDKLSLNPPDPSHVRIAARLRDGYFEWREKTTEIPWEVAALTGGSQQIGHLITLDGSGPAELCVRSGGTCRTDHPFFNFHDGSFTFSVNVKPGPPTATTAWIAGKSSSWRLTYRPDGRVRLVLWGEGCGTDAQGNELCDTQAVLETEPLVADAWNHVAFSVIGKGPGNNAYVTARLFLDGELQETSSTSTSPNRVLDVVSNSKKLLLGSQFDGSEPFVGSLSHVRMFTAGLLKHEIERLQDQMAIGWQVGSLLGGVQVAGDVMDFTDPGYVKLYGPQAGQPNFPLFSVADGRFTFSINVRPGSPTNYAAWIAGAGGSWRLSYRPDGKVRLRVDPEVGSAVTLDSDTSLPVGMWSNITFTVAPDSTIPGSFLLKLYVDGVAQASSPSQVAGVAASNNGIVLGSHLNASSDIIDPFPGVLAGLRMFKDDLSDSAITGLAHGEIDWDIDSLSGNGVRVLGDVMTFEDAGMVKLCAPEGADCLAGYPLFDVQDETFTFSVDVRPDSTRGGSDWIAGVGCAWRLSEIWDGRVRLRAYENGCTSSTSVYLDTDEPLPVGEWSRITFTMGPNAQGRRSLKLYVDGVLQSATSDGDLGAVDPSSAALVLGGHSDGTSVLDGFSGALRRPRIFMRELDATTVLGLLF